MKVKLLIISLMFGVPVFGQATKQLNVPTKDQYLSWGAAEKSEGGIAYYVMPMDLNKKWAGKVFDSYDFSQAVFQPGTNFSGCKITNCIMFALKKAQTSLVQIAQPESICIPTVDDLPALPPLPPLPAPGQPLPPLPPLPPVGQAADATTCQPQQNPTTQPSTEQVTLPESIFINADFTGADLTGTTFFDQESQQGADLSGTKLSSAVLAGVNFTDCIFNNTDFSGLSLKQVNLSGVDLTLIKNFSKVASLDNTILDFVHAPDVSFPLCSAQNMSIRHAHLEGAVFGTSLGATLNYAGADFTGSNLTGATFWNINPPYNPNAAVQGDTGSSCMLFTSCTMGKKPNSSVLTNFNNSNLHGSSFTAIMAPRDPAGNPQPQLAGVQINNCTYSCVIADDIEIGNLQVAEGDSYGTVYTDIQDTKANLNKYPWSFSNTSLYGAHFTGNRDYYGTDRLSDFGSSSIDANTLLAGARFEQLSLCNACIYADTSTAFARARHDDDLSKTMGSLVDYISSMNCPNGLACPAGLSD